jgi:hypothetical protein
MLPNGPAPPFPPKEPKWRVHIEEPPS